MEKIESFRINHLTLLPGLYVSRKDNRDGVTVTTFDLRLTAPNRAPGIDLTSNEVFPLVTAMCDFIIGYEGEIPGARPEECGNYSEQNLNMAKYYIRKYREELTDNKRFTYPH